MLPPASDLSTDPTWPSTLCAVACLLGFTTIASIDGLYFHLYRYRLYRRAASRYEHLLHTINAVLFVPLLLLCFCLQPLGLWRWLALALFLFTLCIEILDVRCEAASRRDLGGLTTTEYLMHFLMSGLRAGSMLPLLSAGALAQWWPSHTALVARPLWLLILGMSVAIPGVFIAALHVYLALPRTDLVPAPESAIGNRPGVIF
jgi:hypothetical protein